ncbi:bifunctional 2',3'-cyclic-nucleotide 2'-phosphodiesterase/3'-nucleotidase [Ruegeria sp. Alg231-54]|uniref:bifunctional 2',3'-cyclic-nucleotide 2'-phosphodiesterase/3'-nucleotidase n=1 Tax=Ruegeria sp. Alg231-54 TaxID=1922221 RepID=UPI002101011C|nr:bifunctional 2',3'-cyclic-nucleotide 2'-phosphodiesterase/3'-nucleotidase [Ruegeria sp. Alg231-54]
MQIRILATTDLHMNLRSFDYYSDTPEPTIGLTRTASLIREARTEAQADGSTVLLFDNGDSLQGTPVGELAAEQADKPHALMQAFGALEYDAIGLGNHDFGFGQDILDSILSQAPCPVVCSNVYRPGANEVWQDQAVLTRRVEVAGHQASLTVGVFSVVPPQTRNWESHRLGDDVRIDDILTCARTKVSELRSHGCDVIIALAHTGLGSADPAPDLENAIIPLAAIEGIDAIIAGHTHLTLPGKSHAGLEHVDATGGMVHGTPVVMPGSAGSHLGLIDLTLTATTEKGWAVAAHRVELRPVSGADPAPEDPSLVALFSDVHSATRKRAEEPIGHTDQHLHSYFSFCAKDRGLAMVAAAQASAVRQNLKGTAHEVTPLLSAVAPSKFGGRAGPRFYSDIPAGVMRMRHVADLNIFPNELRAVVVSGEHVRDWLEMSAGVFNQVKPGAQTELVNPDRAGHNFDVLFGLSYVIDLSVPPRFDADGHLVNPACRRISDLRFQGHAVTAEQRFVVALNNYRASGGGHFPFIRDAEIINVPALPIQHALKDYLTGALPTESLEQGLCPFRFAPMPGSSVLLKTGQQAQRHLADITEFSPTLAGTNAEGFLRIQLSL